MPVVSNTATATPVVGALTACGTIAGGPYDNVSVYFTGGLGGSGPIAVSLWTTVNGILTLVAVRNLQGNSAGALIEWQENPSGSGEGFIINAGGSNYTVMIQDLSTTSGPNVPPRQPVTITIAGVNDGDTAADTQQGAVLTATPGATTALTVLPGYAEEMDVAIDQTNIPPTVTVQVIADCGGGSVQGAIVMTAIMGGKNNGIAAIFRNIVLPVATRYFAQITNNSGATVMLTLTAITYSGVTGGGGGPVILTGNANGPSNNNTVQAFPTSTTNANITIATQPHPTGFIYEGFNGLTATRTGFLNPAPVAGDMVIFKDEDGSLATQNFVINGNGKLIDGAATFTMNGANPGAFGSITVLYNGTAWAVV